MMEMGDNFIIEAETQPRRSCDQLRNRQTRKVQPREAKVCQEHDRERNGRKGHDREEHDQEGHAREQPAREGRDGEQHEREGHDFQSCRKAPEKTRALAPEGASPSTLMRWCKFNLVGAIGIVVQFAALFVLKSLLHWNYLAATALAVEAAVVHNFVWHEQFTWADRTRSERANSARKKSLLRLARFNLTTGGVSIVGNLALMKLMVGLGHMNYLLANAIAIVLCSLANFLVSETWVFAGQS
jgi:putative flippase GtrA